MSVREEFEKAFDEAFPEIYCPELEDTFAGAKWAALWMAERCAKEMDELVNLEPSPFGPWLRKLASELKSGGEGEK